MMNQKHNAKYLDELKKRYQSAFWESFARPGRALYKKDLLLFHLKAALSDVAGKDIIDNQRVGGGNQIFRPEAAELFKHDLLCG